MSDTLDQIASDLTMLGIAIRERDPYPELMVRVADIKAIVDGLRFAPTLPLQGEDE